MRQAIIRSLILRDVMGLTYLEIDVGNPADPDTTERIQFLIDSGAVYSVVPTPVLDRLWRGLLRCADARA